MDQQKNYQLLNNSRFYILAVAFLASAGVAAAIRLQIPTDQLFYIRLQQTYGLLCILFWYLAMIISPVAYIIGKHRMKHILFSRRAIGVSAAYFALLHMMVALWGQLGGINEIAYLPSLFKWSLLGGIIAAIILLIMAATSFDEVIQYMTFVRWKWLHRLVYIGGILAVLHIWTIGTHITYSGVQRAAFVALALLGALESYRVVVLMAKTRPTLQTKSSFALFALSIWCLWLSLIFAIPMYVQSYHTNHTRHSNNEHTDSPHGGH